MAKGKSQGKKKALNPYTLAVKAMEQAILDSQTDEAMGHANADSILVGYLRSIGAHELADKFEKVQKWYE